MFDFFPSRSLTIYLAKTFVSRILAVLLMLVLVLQMLDLLSESGNILAQPGNGEAELMRYVGLRLPQLIARFLPYAILLATIITLAGLSQNSEVVAMKAAGLSAHQILAPLLLSALAFSLFSFAFNERVVTRANGTLKAWVDADYGPIPDDPTLRSNLYLSDGQNIVRAARVTGEGRNTVLHDVTYYLRDDNDMIVREMRGLQARYVGPGWMLDGARQFDVGPAAQTTLTEPVLIARDLNLAQLDFRRVDADAETLPQLAASIDELKAAGRRTSELEGKWWHKISGPLSAVLMPLLGAVAGFGLARSGQLLARSIIGMTLGFAYFVVDNAALAMGSFGGYPPLIAAWAPFVLFFLLGETVLIRTEE